jgi:type IV pilus assembly protein PilP
VETRTKKLVTLLVIVAVAAGGFYAYKYFIAEKPAPPQIVAKMGAPVATKPGPAQVAPAVSAPATAAPPAVAPPAAPGKPAIAIKVMEKGKEIQYSSPEEFVAKTSLPPIDVENFSKKSLDHAKKRLEAARAGKNKAAIAAAEEEVKVFEKLNSLVAVRVKESAGRKTYTYASLGKRDPFMNPLEIPKSYPPIPLNAKPVERVPVEQISVKAIIWSQKGYRAMVVTPDGRSYTVKAGDRIGDKLGNITKITTNRIYVTEKIRDILGDVETKNTIMQLHHKEAE